MAVDKLVDSTQLDADLTSVANAIRTKGGTSAQLAFPAGFVSAVQNIQTGITPSGTKQISITENGTTTEDVTNYASAEITVNISGGGGYTIVNGAQSPSASGAGAGIYWNPLNVNLNTRALVIPNSGTTTYSWWTSGTRNINNYTKFYLHDIPTGATKVSVYSDKQVQFHVTTGYRESSTSFPSAHSGWMNSPIIDYAIPSLHKYASILFRINDSDDTFSEQNMPTSIRVEFS